MVKKTKRSTQKARVKKTRPGKGKTRSRDASPKTHRKDQIESLRKLARTQGFSKKDYMNVFMLAKEIQAKNTSLEKDSLRKKVITKGSKEGSMRGATKSESDQKMKSRR